MAIAGTLTYKTELDTSGVKKSGSTVKSIIAGLGITKLISKGISAINSSIDDAVKRVDVLNNFPKVMSNLGISAKEADKSIKLMSDKLSGLPTTLDQGAMAVQRFTSANGDVAKSTDIFLALNNAILAGGASTEIQASALEQMSQAYAKGKPDMMEWRTLMTAMPAQLKQVATAMGYVDASALGEDLRQGNVSMDQFMDTIVKLNKEGTAGFQSFEQQARNSTGGIGTAITVAKTQVVKGVADMIMGLNEALTQANLPTISEIITSIGQKIKEVLDAVASRLPAVISFLQTMAPLLVPIVTAIAVFKTMTILIGIIEGITTAVGALNVVLLANPIALVVAGIAGLIAVFIYLWNECDAFREFWINLWNQIMEILQPVIDSMVEMFKSAWELIKVVWDYVQPYFELIFNNIKIYVDVLKKNLTIAFTTAWNVIKSVWSVVGAYFKAVFDTITGIFKVIKSVLSGDFRGAWEAIKGIFAGWGNYFKSLFNAVVNIFSSIGSAFLNIGKNIVQGIWNGISGSLGWIKDRLTSWIGDVTKFIKKLFKIGSPSKLMEDEVGQWLPKGIAVGIEANTDSVQDAMDDMYKEMNSLIKAENAKLNFDVSSNDMYNKSLQLPAVIDLNAQFDGTVPVELNLDGEKIWSNQQKVSLRKSVQYGGAK